MNSRSDAELVRQAKQGNAEAVGNLYDRYQPNVYRYVRSRIYDAQLAHDITGDVFLRMVRSLSQYEDRGLPFTAWLFRIAHNVIIHHIEKEGQMTWVEVTEQETAVSEHAPENPADIVAQQWEFDRVLGALEQIQADQRDVIALRFLAGLSLKETAETLERTVGAVKTLQHRGLHHLQILLAPEPALRGETIR